jgi:hypothetical protein
MVKFFIYLKLVLISFNTFAQYPSLDWARNMSPKLDSFSSSKFHENKCHDMAVDKDGNVYTVGTYSQQTDFDPGTGVFYLTPNNIGTASLSTYIVKLSAAGNFVWAKSLSTNTFGYYVTIPYISLDKSSNVIITGMYNYTTDFDPSSTGTFFMTPIVGNNNADAYILKLDVNGNFIWVKQLGGLAGNAPTGCATDDNNNIYSIGTFTDGMDMDPSSAVNLVWPLTGFGAYLSKLDSNGNYIYGKALVGTDHVRAFEINVKNNVMVICGLIEGLTDVDFSNNTQSISSTNGDGQAYTLCLDTAANFQWVHTVPNLVGGITSSTASDVALGNNGAVFTSGYFKAAGGVFGDSLNFGNNGINIYKSSDTGNIFVIKYNSNGAVQWVSTMCHSGAGSTRMAIDANDNIYNTGVTVGDDSTDFDPSGLVYPVINGSNGVVDGFPYSQDGYVCKLNTNGKLVWARAIYGSYNEAPKEIAISSDQSIYIGGHFGANLTTNTVYNVPDTMDCDPTSGVSNLISGNWFDLFLVKWDQASTSDPLSITKLFHKKTLQIFPNPARNNFSFDAPIETTLSIRNILGEVVYWQKAKAGLNQVDIGALSVGTYFVSVDNAHAILIKQ